MSNQAEEQPVHTNLTSLLSLNYWTVLRKVLNLLPFADVLRLRVLNRKTCSTIDNFLEDRLVVALKRYHNKLTLTPNDLVFNGNTQKYGVITKPVATWMKLQLAFWAVEDQRFVHFLPWLRLHGPQVYMLWSKCCMKLDKTSPVNTLKNLRSVLICTENVQMIALVICCNYPEPDTEQRWANQVSAFLEKYPFPPLRKLDHVWFAFALSTLDHFQFPSCASTIFQHFLQAYGAQIRTLEFKVQTVDQLKILQHSKAPLKHLNINIHPSSPITPTQVLQALEPFQSTLQELAWTQNYSFALIDSPKVEWPWALVESLRLKAVNCWITFKDDEWLWLDCFPYVRRLTIDSMMNGIISAELNEYLMMVKRSNIWTRLPKLQIFEIYGTKLTRCTCQQ